VTSGISRDGKTVRMFEDYSPAENVFQLSLTFSREMPASGT
jgi:hypothetical protein